MEIKLILFIEYLLCKKYFINCYRYRGLQDTVNEILFDINLLVFEREEN